jgi:hypothetical protein
MSDEITTKETQLNDLLAPSNAMPQVTTPEATSLHHAATPQWDNRTPEPMGAIAAAGAYSPIRSPNEDSSDNSNNEFEE